MVGHDSAKTFRILSDSRLKGSRETCGWAGIVSKVIRSSYDMRNDTLCVSGFASGQYPALSSPSLYVATLFHK
jgi:hypothetical protein